ncbi:unnamed protein product [Ilex paraguariensis]|uniref:Uncharacterized protein n=1 Tax=Ilex paraguariensis TaxID=185542 RepID=A0ABC8U486_9AQUA
MAQAVAVSSSNFGAWSELVDEGMKTPAEVVVVDTNTAVVDEVAQNFDLGLEQKLIEKVVEMDCKKPCPFLSFRSLHTKSQGRELSCEL